MQPNSIVRAAPLLTRNGSVSDLGKSLVEECISDMSSMFLEYAIDALLVLSGGLMTNAD